MGNTLLYTNSESPVQDAQGLSWEEYTWSPLVWGVCLVGSVILLAFPFGSFSQLPESAVIWGTTGVLFCLAVYAFRLAKENGENPWITPMSLIIYYYFYRYGWGTLVAYYYDSLPWKYNPDMGEMFLRHGIKANLANTCHFLLLGGLGFFLGLGLSTRAICDLLPKLRWPVDEERFKHNLVIYSPFAVFAYAFLGKSLEGGELQYFISLFGWIIGVIFILGSYWLFTSSSVSERNRWLLFVVCLYASSLILACLTGSVGHFLFPLLFIIVGYILARRSLPKKLILISFILSFLVLLPILTIFKQEIEPLFFRRISNSIDKFIDIGFMGRTEIALERGLFRLSSVRLPAVFSQYYPNTFPYEHGNTFKIEIMAQIPRILWPQKPNYALELNYYTYSIGMLDKPDQTSGIMDAISEYYINFGIFGVFIFSLLHGYYFKILYDWLCRRSNYLIGASVFLAIFFNNIDFNGLLNQLARHVRMLLVWLVLLYQISKKTS